MQCFIDDVVLLQRLDPILQYLPVGRPESHDVESEEEGSASGSGNGSLKPYTPECEKYNTIHVRK